jgi:hypothetical protein
VDVVVDYVRRRRSDLRRRHHPDRHRTILRCRQHKRDHGRRRWRQVDEIDRRRRQKDHRRRGRRSKVKIRIVEREHRTLDVSDFVRQRWRHVVFDDFESRGRLETGGKLVQAAAGII